MLQNKISHDNDFDDDINTTITTIMVEGNDNDKLNDDDNSNYNEK